MEYTHYMLDGEGRVVGLAGQVEKVDDKDSFAFVYLFGMVDFAEFGYIENARLLPLKVPIKSSETPKPEEAVV